MSGRFQTANVIYLRRPNGLDKISFEGGPGAPGSFKIQCVTPLQFSCVFLMVFNKLRILGWSESCMSINFGTVLLKFNGMRILCLLRSASEASISVKSKNVYAHGPLRTAWFRKQKAFAGSAWSNRFGTESVMFVWFGPCNEIHVRGGSDVQISFQIRSMSRWSCTFSFDLRALQVPALRDFFDFVLGFFCLVRGGRISLN